VHLVDLTIEIYYDARSYKGQILCVFLATGKACSRLLFTHMFMLP